MPTKPPLDQRPSFIERGSTVRVRQRALQRPRKAGLFLLSRLARSAACSEYGALYGGPSGPKRPPLPTPTCAAPLGSDNAGHEVACGTRQMTATLRCMAA